MVYCGKLGKTFGVKGELVVYWNNDVPPLSSGEEIYLQEKENYKALTVIRSNVKPNKCTIALQGVSTPEDAKKLTNSKLYLPENLLPELDEDEYYSYQLLGMTVLNEEGKKVGTLTNIFNTGSNDIYEVLPDGAKAGAEHLIPAVKEVILKVDKEKNEMIIHELPGLIESENSMKNDASNKQSQKKDENAI